MDPAKSASKEGLVLVIGDLNLDLEKFEDRQRKRLRISTPLPHSERKSRVFLPLSSLAMSGKIFSPCSHSIIRKIWDATQLFDHSFVCEEREEYRV